MPKIQVKRVNFHGLADGRLSAIDMAITLSAALRKVLFSSGMVEKRQASWKAESFACHVKKLYHLVKKSNTTVLVRSRDLQRPLLTVEDRSTEADVSTIHWLMELFLFFFLSFFFFNVHLKTPDLCFVL